MQATPSALRISSDDDGGDGGLDTLTEVSLTSLSLTPETIGPFSAAVLAWDVDGPGPPARWGVFLNRVPVARRSEKVVQPPETTAYVLTAAAGGFTRHLGTVNLRVNLADCTTYALALDARQQLEGALRNVIAMRADLSLRVAWVRFAPGRISFFVQVRKALEGKPDATAYIYGAFGLAIRDGDVVSVAIDVSATVRLPVYVRPPIVSTRREAKAGHLDRGRRRRGRDHPSARMPRRRAT